MSARSGGKEVLFLLRSQQLKVKEERKKRNAKKSLKAAINTITHLFLPCRASISSGLYVHDLTVIVVHKNKLSPKPVWLNG